MLLELRYCLCAIVLSTFILFGLTLPTFAQCKLYGGIGTGISQDIAKFMANAAVKNIIENKGLKPTGKISNKCKGEGVLFECSAHQQGCK